MNKGNTILLTSFGAFPGAPVNPTRPIAALAARHAGPRLARMGLRLACAELPVVFGEIESALAALQAEHQPRAILHLGLAAGRRIMTPEIRAANHVTQRHRDAAGQLSALRAVARGAPETLTATLSAARLARVIKSCGAAAAPSRDAGAYVCNQTLYLSLLHGKREARGGQLAGFIHVPRPRAPQRLTSSASAPDFSGSRPTLRAMARAVAACLMDIAAQLRRQAAPHRAV